MDLEVVKPIKEKRCGKTKVKNCANFSKQRRYLKDGENISSSTVLMEAPITKLIIYTV